MRNNLKAATLHGNMAESLGKLPEDQLVNFIHSTRKAMRMSQRELSKISGVNQSNLSKIENGLITPSISTIRKIALCLGHQVELRFVPTFDQTTKVRAND